MNFNVTMIDDRVAIRPTAQEDHLKKTEGGLFVPAESKFTRYQTGTVVHSGKGRYENGTFIPNQTKAGDTVLYEKGSRQEFMVNGEVLLLMKERDLIAVLGVEESERKIITINAKPYKCVHDEISYETVVNIAIKERVIPSNIYTVTFSNGQYKHAGALSKGETVKVVDGMIFNVALTTNA